MRARPSLVPPEIRPIAVFTVLEVVQERLRMLAWHSAVASGHIECRLPDTVAHRLGAAHVDVEVALTLRAIGRVTGEHSLRAQEIFVRLGVDDSALP
jgi:hypothetical protein